MTDTPRLGLPLLSEAQENPDQRINPGRYILDALCQSTVIRRDLTAPPGGEAEGDAYIPAAGATGAWAGHVDDLAVFQGGGYQFYQPKSGWEVWSLLDGAKLRYGVQGSPSTWTVAAASITVSQPGSPSVTVEDVEVLQFDNATVVDQGGGSVLVTPISGAGSAALTSYDNTSSGLTATNVQDAIDEVAAAGGGGSSYPPDEPPGTPNAADDEFTGAALDTAGTRFSGATAWATINAGTAVYTQADGFQRVELPAASGNNLRGFEQVISGNGKWRAKICAANHAENFNTVGFFFRVNASDRWQGVVTQWSGGMRQGTQRMDSRSTFSAASIHDALYGGVNSWVYMELEYDGTNVHFRMSGSGVEGTFKAVGEKSQAAVAGHLGAVPDRIVLAAESNNSSFANAFVVEWFRKVA